MGAYRTVVVGTDGSDTSFRAVERAAFVAGDTAKLLIASAHLPHGNDQRAIAALRDESYKVTGSGPVYDILHSATERAHTVGAKDVEDRVVEGAPVDALLHLAEQENADLLVVGSVGANTIAGRLLGSVSSEIMRKAKIDVLIVHTT
ncbi:universal stress protein [Mycobacterium sp.]|uniref:universal stress protein n=1 Tax=Mycobacterium sp. TaxID=1785 RepID=UPI003A8B17F5